MRSRSRSLSTLLARVAAVLVFAAAVAACSDDDTANDAESDAGSEATPASAEPVGTLTFGGASYELTRADCEVGGDGLSRWFAFDADGDVELAVYEGDVDSISLLVRDDHADGPSWEQTEDPSLIELDGDEAGVSGTATVTPAAIGDDEPSGDGETVEFDLSC